MRGMRFSPERAASSTWRNADGGWPILSLSFSVLPKNPEGHPHHRDGSKSRGKGGPPGPKVDVIFARLLGMQRSQSLQQARDSQKKVLADLSQALSGL